MQAADVAREALHPEALSPRLNVPHAHGAVARRTDHLVAVTLQRRHRTWLGLGVGVGVVATTPTPTPTPAPAPTPTPTPNHGTAVPLEADEAPPLVSILVQPPQRHLPVGVAGEQLRRRDELDRLSACGGSLSRRSVLPS